MGKAWIIASGKGGVGKSTISACLAVGLASQGQRVCIVDADIGLREQDALLGLENRIVYDLVDVANKDCTLSQALVTHSAYPGLTLLPAAQFAQVKDIDPKAFRRILSTLKAAFDQVIIDSPAGVDRGFRGLLNNELDECVVICTPDDVCIRDVERVTTMMMSMQMPRPRVIVNRLDPELIRAGEMYSAQTVAITLDTVLLGEIPYDSAIYRAQLKHISPMKVACEGRQALLRITRRMMGHDEPLPGYGTKPPSFLEKLFRRKLKEMKEIE